MFVRNSSRIRLGLKCPFLIRLFHGKRGLTMDFLTGNIKTIYFKYLSAAFGSPLISCIFGADTLWFAMPITELLAFFYAAFSMKKGTKELPTQ